MSPELCPWDWTAQWGAPDLSWCEATRCGWLVEPSNALSSLAQCGVGIAILLGDSRARGRLALLPVTMIVCGFLSFGYHASHSYLGQVLDHVGMMAWTGALITLNFVRGGLQRAWVGFAGWMVASLAVLAAVHFAGLRLQLTVLAAIAFLAMQELRLARSGLAAPDYRPWWASFALLALGLMFSAADLNRVYCEPYSWVHGHAIWHLWAGVSMAATYVFYRRMAAVEI